VGMKADRGRTGWRRTKPPATFRRSFRSAQKRYLAMDSRDPRIDAYIDKAADFARPILRHVREVVHAACPEVGETMKWSFPHFEYKGTLCSMAAFKEHCTLGFWNAEQVLGGRSEGGAMGHFGRITRLEDLPPRRVLAGYVKRAVSLKDAGVKVKRAPRRAAAEVEVPEDLAAALKRSAKARKAFEGFSPSHRREYVEWILEAKREATRAKRLAQTVEWLAQGKARNWKYL